MNSDFTLDGLLRFTISCFSRIVFSATFQCAA
jgi:hypothetical protein